MTNNYQERIDYFLGKVGVLSDRLQDNGSELTVPTPAIQRKALEGLFNRRTGALLAKPATFREKPLGSLLRRILDFHRGSGYLGSVFSIEGDARLLIEFDEERYGAYWTDKKSKMATESPLVAGMTTRDLYDQLDTMALLMIDNKSTAAANWQRALHG